MLIGFKLSPRAKKTLWNFNFSSSFESTDFGQICIRHGDACVFQNLVGTSVSTYIGWA